VHRLLFRRRAGLRPDATSKVELFPFRRLYLATARAGEQQEAEDVRCLLILKRGQCLCQLRKFGRRQIAVALLLVVSLDPLGRVVSAPTST
jgi:hypothetical protein